MAIYDKVRGGYRVFIGDLGSRIDRNDLEREFEYFGTLMDVWVARNPPGFGFVVFKNADDAERAVKKLHGRSLCGRRVRVEHAYESGAKKEERRLAESVRYRGGSSRRSRSRSRDRRRSPSYESQRRSTASRRRSPSDEPRSQSSRLKKQSSDESRQRSDPSRRDTRSRSHSVPGNSHRQGSRSPERKGDRLPSEKNNRDSTSTSRSRSRSASRKKATGKARSGSSDD